MNNSSLPRRSAGLTLLEILVVVATIGVLSGLVAFAFRAPASRIAANDYKAMLQEGRLEAVKRNRAVIVEWLEDDKQVVLRAVSSSGVVACNAPSDVLKSLDLTDYREVSFATTMTEGAMVWLPNGRSQQCNGSLVATTSTFTDGSRQALIHVSSVGEVRVETR